MASFAYFCDRLGPRLLRTAGPAGAERTFRRVELLEADAEEPDCLYIADPAALEARLACGEWAAELLIVVADGPAPGLPTALRQSVAITDLAPVKLFALAQELLEIQWEWERTLMAACYELHTQEAVIRAAADCLGVPLYLLDNGYTMLHAAGTVWRAEHPLRQELDLTSHLNLAAQRALAGRQWVRREDYVLFRDENGMMGLRMHTPTREYLTLLAFGVSERDALQLLLLCRRYLLRLEQTPSHAADPFHSFLTNLCAGIYTSAEEVTQQFRALGLPYRPERDFYHCVTVTGDAGDKAFDTRLAALLHTQTMTRYDGRLVALICSESDYYRPREVDLDALDALLRRHGCRACIGDCDKLSALYDRYLLNVLAHRVDEVRGDRQARSYFFVDDYLCYIILELAAGQFVQGYGASRVGLLLDPRVRMLNSYDKLHGTDLSPTLYAYLMHYNSLARTAGALYVHKNTVLNKIRHVREMLDLDLESPKERLQLLLSFWMSKYMIDFFGLPKLDIPPGGTVARMK